MEYIDIIDKNGKPTGETKSREDVHKHGLLHRHVHVWILNSKNQVLLQKRAATKRSYPNMWACSVEGHVSAGKSLSDTVENEISEELNISVNKNDLEPVFSFHRGPMKFGGDWVENAINNVFIVNNETPVSKMKIQKSEVSEVRWMDLKDYKHEIDSKAPAYRAYPEEFPKLFKLIKENMV